jgi:HEAT repeat protein
VSWRSLEELTYSGRTSNQDLRLSVQYALGRVSDDPAVVDVLVENMQGDPNPLFRDKAACALAYDQIHLSEAQKVRLFAGLIHALGDSKPQVRAIAIQALEIHTGQRKGFAPDADPSVRAAAVAQWQEWLRRYEDSVR